MKLKNKKSRNIIGIIQSCLIFALVILVIFMIFKPELLWKIEHFFSVKGGEPTDLYLGLMRVAGVFFFIASIICIIVLVL